MFLVGLLIFITIPNPYSSTTSPKYVPSDAIIGFLNKIPSYNLLGKAVVTSKLLFP